MLETRSLSGFFLWVGFQFAWVDLNHVMNLSWKVL